MSTVADQVATLRAEALAEIEALVAEEAKLREALDDVERRQAIAAHGAKVANAGLGEIASALSLTPRRTRELIARVESGEATTEPEQVMLEETDGAGDMPEGALD